MKVEFIVFMLVAIQSVFVVPTPESIVAIMLFALGLGMNGLAVIGNGDKMPVRNGIGETMHHRPENTSTRYRLFIDKYNVAGQIISIGDIFISNGLFLFLAGFITRALIYIVKGRHGG